MINSRDKGAQFEREVAAAMHKLTGIKFERNLEQYRTKGQGDLIADDPSWPFMIECKRAAAENGRRQQWQRQALDQAGRLRQLPCVIYRLDRKSPRVLVPLPAMMRQLSPFWAWEESAEWAEMSLPGFCYVAKIMMEDRKS